MENHKIVIPKVVAVAYERCLFTRGSNCRALTGPNSGVLHLGSLMGGGRLREVVAHGSSTVHTAVAPTVYCKMANSYW